METAEIAAKLKAFLEDEFPYQGLTLTESTDLLDDWFVDSLGVIETVLFIETNFNVTMARADVNGSNFKDIGTLSRFITSRLDAGSDAR